MKRRYEDRLAAAASLLLLLVLAAGSYYLAEMSRRFASAPGSTEPRHEPDYFVEDLVLTRVNAQGDPAFRLSAQRMVHYPDDDSTAYERPVLVSLDPARPPLRLVANTGTSTADGVETRLHGDVVMTREEAPGEPPMTVRTDYVVLYSLTEIAKTDRPVEIDYGSSILTGVGMEFDNAARSLTVDSQVRGTWQLAPKTR
jgi:lipopolysaccharide export system protein LptC